MVCVVISITVSILNISPILNTQLYFQDSCERNCPIFFENKIFDIVMSYKSMRIFLKGKKRKSNFIAQKILFFELFRTGDLIRKPHTY